MMSKDVILEKLEHIVIYKIVEYYKQIKRKDIIELTKKIYKDLFEREVSDDAVINWIREITGFREEYNEQTRIRELKPVKDKRKKLEILKVRPGGIYEIANVSVKPANKNIWDEVDRYLKLRRENRIISNELRVKHTEKIKERVIRPWIMILSGEINSVKSSSEKFKIIEEDVYYRDLDNHIPLELENPKDIKKLIDEKEKEYAKLEKYLRTDFYINIYEKLELKMDKKIENVDKIEIAKKEMLMDEIIMKRKKYPDVDKILCEIEEILGEIPLEIIEMFVTEDWEKIKKLKKFVEEEGQKLKEERKKLEEKLEKIKDEILKLKKELLNTLKELEAYEILPGVCKYLTGGE